MAYFAKDNRYNNMIYNACGASGLKLPLISLGLWHNFGTDDDYDTMRAICFRAFDRGITHFDLANNYGPMPGAAEENFGRILRQDMKAYRDEMVISTKAGYDMWPGPYGNYGSRKYLLASLDQSLARLKLDYVDIFYHHRPDPNTPLEESMQALDSAVKSGKALYAGISNYDRENFERAQSILRELKCPFISNQIRYSMLDRHIEKDGLKRSAAENGCGLIAFSPLAQGLLSDKYLHGIPPDSRIMKGVSSLKAETLSKPLLEKIAALNNLAAKRGQTLAQMALSWVLRDSMITSVLIGASKPEQIDENIEILNKTSFTQDELDGIERILEVED